MSAQIIEHHHLRIMRTGRSQQLMKNPRMRGVRLSVLSSGRGNCIELGCNALGACASLKTRPSIGPQEMSNLLRITDMNRMEVHGSGLFSDFHMLLGSRSNDSTGGATPSGARLLLSG